MVWFRENWYEEVLRQLKQGLAKCHAVAFENRGAGAFLSLSLSQFVFLSQSVSLSVFLSLSLSHSLLPLFSVQSRSDLSTQAFSLINLSRFCCVLSNSIQHYQTVFCVSKVADATFTLHSSNFVNILLYFFLAT